MTCNAPLSAGLERALRTAAQAHAGQHRKGTDLPYIQHPFAVALVLQRLGYPDDVLQAAALHDAVEDTPLTIERVTECFGAAVARHVAFCSEIKRDEMGRVRPWLQRKQEHLERLRHAPAEARAIALADKWHNLFSIRIDLSAGLPVWDRFNAPRADWLQLTRRFIEALPEVDPPDERLSHLAACCLQELEDLETGAVPSG